MISPVPRTRDAGRDPSPPPSSTQLTSFSLDLQREAERHRSRTPAPPRRAPGQAGHGRHAVADAGRPCRHGRACGAGDSAAQPRPAPRRPSRRGRHRTASSRLSAVPARASWSAQVNRSTGVGKRSSAPPSSAASSANGTGALRRGRRSRSCQRCAVLGRERARGDHVTAPLPASSPASRRAVRARPAPPAALDPGERGLGAVDGGVAQQRLGERDGDVGGAATQLLRGTGALRRHRRLALATILRSLSPRASSIMRSRSASPCRRAAALRSSRRSSSTRARSSSRRCFAASASLPLAARVRERLLGQPAALVDDRAHRLVEESLQQPDQHQEVDGLKRERPPVDRAWLSRDERVGVEQQQRDHQAVDRHGLDHREADEQGARQRARRLPAGARSRPWPRRPRALRRAPGRWRRRRPRWPHR